MSPTRAYSESFKNSSIRPRVNQSIDRSDPIRSDPTMISSSSSFSSSYLIRGNETNVVNGNINGNNFLVFNRGGPNDAVSILRRRRLMTTTTQTTKTMRTTRTTTATAKRKKITTIKSNSDNNNNDIDFYDEISARNDTLVELMLERIRSKTKTLKMNENEDKKEDKKEEEEERTQEVYLVGCGPGDPGLLTLKAYHLIVTADVVLYDRLVSPEILEYAMEKTDGLMLFVGKRSGFHTRTQDEIHDLILEFANAGATVVRLKGGDPLVFGRGGEECEFLREKGFSVKVIPGITAASGVGSAAGVPLTHRGVATSARLLTGHLMKNIKNETGQQQRETAQQQQEQEEDCDDGAVDFAVTAADADTTLIIYMGLGTLPKTKKKLLKNGCLKKQTPCLAVENGTTLKERRVFSTLEYIDEAVVDAKLQSPTLLFIGDAVRLSPYFPEELLISSSSSLNDDEEDEDDDIELLKWELQVGKGDEDRMFFTKKNGGRCRIMKDINDAAAREWFEKNAIREKFLKESSAYSKSFSFL